MIQSVSWQQFIQLMIVLSLIYYGYVLLRYFRRELFYRKSRKVMAAGHSESPDREAMDHLLDFQEVLGSMRKAITAAAGDEQQLAESIMGLWSEFAGKELGEYRNVAATILERDARRLGIDLTKKEIQNLLTNKQA